MDKIDAEVLGLVQRWVSNRARMSSELYHELGLYGDDIFELLTEIRKSHATSFDTLNFDAYFPSEGWALPRLARKLFGMKDMLYGSCTVAHLAEVVRRGKWFDPNADTPHNELGH